MVESQVRSLEEKTCRLGARQKGSKRPQAVVLLGELERLRQALLDIESRHKALEPGYAQICDGAITRLRTVADELQQKTPLGARGDEDPDRARYLASNLEARRMLGLVSQQQYRREEVLIRRRAARSRFSPGVFFPAVGALVEDGIDGLGDAIAGCVGFLLSLCGRLARLVRA
jgi:hypothetical protein